MSHETQPSARMTASPTDTRGRPEMLKGKTPSFQQSRKAGRWLAALTALLSMALAVVCSVTVYESRIATYNRADAAADNFLTAIRHDILQTLELYDIALNGLRDSVQAQQGKGGTSESRRMSLIYQPLLEKMTDTFDLGALLVLNDRGEVLVSSVGMNRLPSSLANQDYFMVHQERPDVGLYISRPFHSLVEEGDWRIALSRRITHPDGSFGGVVVATLRLRYFDELFGSMVLGAHDAVTLLSTDGHVIARRPFEDRIIGADLSQTPEGKAIQAIPEGHGDFKSQIDGITRLTRFGRIDGLPLIAVVGLDKNEVLAEWRDRMLAMGILTLMLCWVVLVLVIVLRRELARRGAAEQRAAANAQRYRLVADNISDIIIHIGPDGVDRYVSPSMREVFGYENRELADMHWLQVVHPDDRPMVKHELADARSSGRQRTLEFRCYRKDGALLWLEAHIGPMPGQSGAGAEGTGLLINARDITRRKQAEDRLSEIAATDALTGLANRRRFDEVLEQEWRRAMRDGQYLALLLLDADYFKSYNDTYGHQSGDELLRTIATCLVLNTRRPGDFTCRYGGEEFAVILPATDSSGAGRVAEQIRKAVQDLAVTHVGNATGVATVSVGVAYLRPVTGLRPGDLVHVADTALYAAKRNGRNRVELGEEILCPIPQ